MVRAVVVQWCIFAWACQPGAWVPAWCLVLGLLMGVEGEGCW